MCDVQRYTFDEVEDIQVELDARLAANSVTSEQYRAFKDDLIDSPELRETVAIEFTAYCDTGSYESDDLKFFEGTGRYQSMRTRIIILMAALLRTGVAVR